MEKAKVALQQYIEQINALANQLINESATYEEAIKKTKSLKWELHVYYGEKFLDEVVRVITSKAMNNETAKDYGGN